MSKDKIRQFCRENKFEITTGAYIVGGVILLISVTKLGKVSSFELRRAIKGLELLDGDGVLFFKNGDTLVKVNGLIERATVLSAA